MKHALLITAYKDFAVLHQLISKFDARFSIYIHIDKKSKISPETLQNLQKNKNVQYCDTDYKVNWGGVNHLKSYLLLCRKALENTENKFFHLITAEDFPVKSLAYFDALFCSDTGTNYMEYFPLPSTEWELGGLNRLEYYHLYDVLNAKSTFGRFCIKQLVKLQRLFGFKRTMPFSQPLFGGSTYWSLSREAVQYVITFTQNHPAFLPRFDHTFCAEEIYFQTILMNSIYAEKINNNNLRYTDWVSGKGGYPAYLDDTDFTQITESAALFARKISSKKLKEMISDYAKST